MTRFVATLLVATDGTVKASVDPRTPGAERLGQVRAAALLARAHRKGRERRRGTEAVRKAGREAWEIHQQRGGGQ